jgi:predicted nucleic acid-binding protein
LKPFLDTSVLIPVFLVDHPHHAASMELFLRCERQNAFCAAHTLAEVYSTLTRLPPPHRATTQQAKLFLDSVCDRLTPVGLDAAEYHAALREAAALDVVGGAFYDFLISRCALKVKANPLYTWNLRHYTRFGAELLELVQSPTYKSDV